mmetsp:Transcript_68605/g.178688  ORF Transcript_68605/g.178688 Transcript_68605/m.178688 type:complete len:234 (+) Transcript_68605:76-777(+)
MLLKDLETFCSVCGRFLHVSMSKGLISKWMMNRMEAASARPTKTMHTKTFNKMSPFLSDSLMLIHFSIASFCSGVNLLRSSSPLATRAGSGPLLGVSGGTTSGRGSFLAGAPPAAVPLASARPSFVSLPSSEEPSFLMRLKFRPSSRPSTFTMIGHKETMMPCLHGSPSPSRTSTRSAMANSPCFISPLLEAMKAAAAQMPAPPASSGIRASPDSSAATAMARRGPAAGSAEG